MILEIRVTKKDGQGWGVEKALDAVVDTDERLVLGCHHINGLTRHTYGFKEILGLSKSPPTLSNADCMIQQLAAEGIITAD